MIKFMAALSLTLMSFHTSSAMEAQGFSFDPAKHFEDRRSDGWTIYANTKENHISNFTDYNPYLKKSIKILLRGNKASNGIYLSNTNADDEVIKIILSRGIETNNIYKLDLSYTDMSATLVKELCNGLKLMSNLSYIELNGCPVNDKCIDILYDLRDNIQHLSLRQTPLTEEGLTMLGKLCNMSQKITSLGIGQHNVNGQALCNLIKGIKVPNLSIYLSKDLKGIIQEALYKEGFQYDNLDVFFPQDTSYQDFFINNLFFKVEKIQITYEVPSSGNCPTNSLDHDTAVLASCPVDRMNLRTNNGSPYIYLLDNYIAKYTMHINGFCKKGDFIGLAKNIEIYSNNNCRISDNSFALHTDSLRVHYSDTDARSLKICTCGITQHGCTHPISGSLYWKYKISFVPYDWIQGSSYNGYHTLQSKGSFDFVEYPGDDMVKSYIKSVLDDTTKTSFLNHSFHKTGL